MPNGGGVARGIAHLDRHIEVAYLVNKEVVGNDGTAARETDGLGVAERRNVDDGLLQFAVIAHGDAQWDVCSANGGIEIKTHLPILSALVGGGLSVWQVSHSDGLPVLRALGVGDGNLQFRIKCGIDRHGHLIVVVEYLGVLAVESVHLVDAPGLALDFHGAQTDIVAHLPLHQHGIAWEGLNYVLRRPKSRTHVTVIVTAGNERAEDCH